MIDMTRRGFFGEGLEAVLLLAFSNFEGKSLKDLTDDERIHLATEMNQHLVHLNAKVGIGLPNSNPKDANTKKFDEYLEGIWSEYVLGAGHPYPLKYDPKNKTFVDNGDIMIFYVPLWVRNDIKEQGIQFTDYPEQKEGIPRTKEQVQTILKYYI